MENVRPAHGLELCSLHSKRLSKRVDDRVVLVPRSLIEETVADAIPRGLWSFLSIKEIKAEAIQQELAQSELSSILDNQGFSREECDDLLADVQGDDLWKRLPFHWSCHGLPVSANNIFRGKRVDCSLAGITIMER